MYSSYTISQFVNTIHHFLIKIHCNKLLALKFIVYNNL